MQIAVIIHLHICSIHMHACMHARTHARTHACTHNHFKALWTVCVCVVPEGTFCHLLDFLVQKTITQADAPTIRMDCHPIQTNWCLHLCHPHHFYAGCPSWHEPPNLSWLGTGTKYAGLHTHTHNRLTALWTLTRITQMSRYQKKHSPTHT